MQLDSILCSSIEALQLKSREISKNNKIFYRSYPETIISLTRLSVRVSGLHRIIVSSTYSLCLCLVKLLLKMHYKLPVTHTDFSKTGRLLLSRTYKENKHIWRNLAFILQNSQFCHHNVISVFKCKNSQDTGFL